MPDTFQVVIQSTGQVIDTADRFKAAEVLRQHHEVRLGGEPVRIKLAARMLSTTDQAIAERSAARTIKSSIFAEWNHGGRKPTRSVVTQSSGGTLTLNYFD